VVLALWAFEGVWVFTPKSPVWNWLKALALSLVNVMGPIAILAA
jgi:hypothetical protein